MTTWIFWFVVDINKQERLIIGMNDMGNIFRKSLLQVTYGSLAKLILINYMHLYHLKYYNIVIKLGDKV